MCDGCLAGAVRGLDQTRGPAEPETPHHLLAWREYQSVSTWGEGGQGRGGGG